MNLGHTLANLRNQRGLNQRELAKAIGVSNGAVAMWETNKRQPDLEMLKKLASFFAVSIDFLLGEDTDSHITMNELLGYSGEDESAVSFAQKLVNQIDCNNTKLSESPNSISPEIEPSADEYLLILLYREYNRSGVFNKYYGSLEQYFPGITVVDNSIDNKFLSIFRQLNEDNKDIIIGEIKKFLKEQRNEKSVDSDNQLGKSLA